MVFHVLKRGVGRRQPFFRDEDYLAFERVIVKTLEKRPMRILSYCLMPNHWHFTRWPEKDGELGRFMQRWTVTHVTRWQEHHHMVGYGYVYQGRYKSFPVEADAHFYHVSRYTERNALRGNLVTRAEDWPWGSLWIQASGTPEHRAMLAPWPLPRSRQWTAYVNQPASPLELEQTAMDPSPFLARLTWFARRGHGADGQRWGKSQSQQGPAGFQGRLGGPGTLLSPYAYPKSNFLSFKTTGINYCLW